MPANSSAVASEDGVQSPSALRNPTSSRDTQIADIMSDYWVNFARSGNPNGPGLTQWQPYTEAEPNYVELNVTAQAATDITPAA